MFEGLTTALVTPFESDGHVDLEIWSHLIQKQMVAGTDFCVVAGSTGEGATLSRDEWRLLIVESLKITGGSMGIIANCGTSSTAESCERAREAERLGAQGLLVACPPYNKAPQRGLVAHFEAVARASSLPLMVYNIPGRSAVNLNPETLAHLWKQESIVALKESSGQLDQALIILRDLPPTKTFLSGDDAWTLPLMALGASGVVSVFSNLFPALLKKLCTLMTDVKLEEARHLHQELMELMPLLFLESNPIVVKWALSFLTKKDMPLRLPLVDCDSKFHGLLMGPLERLAQRERDVLRERKVL